MTFKSALDDAVCYNPATDKQNDTGDQASHGTRDATINRAVMGMHRGGVIQAFMIMNHDTSA